VNKGGEGGRACTYPQARSRHPSEPRPAQTLPAKSARSCKMATMIVASIASNAQVLKEEDPYIPAGSEPPRRGAVPVRFFGTYDFSWIESQRMLQPFQEGYADKSRQPDEDGFGASVREAQDFLVRYSAIECAFESGMSPLRASRGRLWRPCASRRTCWCVLPDDYVCHVHQRKKPLSSRSMETVLLCRQRARGAGLVLVRLYVFGSQWTRRLTERDFARCQMLQSEWSSIRATSASMHVWLNCCHGGSAQGRA